MAIGDAVNDNEGSEPMVFIITGRIHGQTDDGGSDIHVLVAAPDDDTAVREALNALAQEGYERAELNQIGTVEEMPLEEPHASAYQGALEGEVAIITFEH